MFSARALLSFCFVVSLASSALGAEAFAPARSIASVSAEAGGPEAAQEAELVSEIDRQADVVFKDFVATSGTRVPLDLLQKAKRSAIYRLKQMHILTDILRASGPAPATTILATEVLTNFVLAPLATAFGKPAVAGVMVTVPWGVVAGFGVFSFQIMKERYKIARSLGLRSLRPLDKFRTLVIGYDIKHRVSSVVYQSLVADLGPVEFEVLRKGWNFETAKMPAIRIAELEALVRSEASGAGYLETIHMDKLDSSFYSALLLRFINESDVLTSKLVSIVRERTPAVSTSASDDPMSLRRHLLGIDDVQMQLDREIRNSQTTKAGLKKRLKKGEIGEFEAKRLRVHAVHEIERLQEVRARLLRHEYAVLLEAQGRLVNGASAETAVIASERAEALVAIALEARVRPPKGAIVDAATVRETPMDRVRAAVRAISARPVICQDLFL